MITFDHVKCLKIGALQRATCKHSSIFKVLMIASSDMQSEENATKTLCRENLNFVKPKNGVLHTNFKGIMGDIDWYSLEEGEKIYENSGPSLLIFGYVHFILIHTFFPTIAP